MKQIKNGINSPTQQKNKQPNNSKPNNREAILSFLNSCSRLTDMEGGKTKLRNIVGKEIFRNNKTKGWVYGGKFISKLSVERLMELLGKIEIARAKLSEKNNNTTPIKITGKELAGLLHGIHEHEPNMEDGKIIYYEKDLLKIFKLLGYPSPAWEISLEIKSFKRQLKKEGRI